MLWQEIYLCWSASEVQSSPKRLGSSYVTFVSYVTLVQHKFGYCLYIVTWLPRQLVLVNMPSTHADWLNEKILEKGILLWYNPLRSFGTNKSNTHKKVSLCFELLCFVSVYHQFQSLVVVPVTKGQQKIWGRCSCRLKFTSRTWLVNWMKHELPSFLYL